MRRPIKLSGIRPQPTEEVKPVVEEPKVEEVVEEKKVESPKPLYTQKKKSVKKETK